MPLHKSVLVAWLLIPWLGSVAALAGDVPLATGCQDRKSSCCSRINIQSCDSRIGRLANEWPTAPMPAALRLPPNSIRWRESSPGRVSEKPIYT